MSSGGAARLPVLMTIIVALMLAFVPLPDRAEPFRRFGVPVIAVGTLDEPGRAEEALAQGRADLVEDRAGLEPSRGGRLQLGQALGSDPFGDVYRAFVRAMGMEVAE